MKARVPQYLHRPVQILWFDSHEVMVLCLGYLGITTLQGPAWIVIVGLTWAAIYFKRRKPRGYLLHLFYRLGLFKLKGYPLPTAGRFYE